MPKDPKRTNASATSGGHDEQRDGTAHGSAAKGYDECASDGSSYTLYGSRVDYNKLNASTFK